MMYTNCPNCGRFTKTLNQIEEKGYILHYCRKCKLIYARHYYYGMNMDGEMEPHDSSIMVNSPVWDLLIRNIILPKGKLVDYRFKKGDAN